MRRALRQGSCWRDEATCQQMFHVKQLKVELIQEADADQGFGIEPCHDLATTLRGRDHAEVSVWAAVPLSI